ncbi:hypothetical protein Ancab_013621 [Ancistrocladus abbreviatus]
MELSVTADILSIAAAQGLGVAKSLLHRATAAAGLYITESPSDQQSSTASTTTAGALQISALVSPIDAVAPPPVRSNSRLIAPLTLLRKRRRTKRRSHSSGGCEDEGSVNGDSGSYNGPFGGSGGGGWNSDGFGGFNWDDSSSHHADPAFDFVYEVVCWIVFSNCLHFAFKKVVRFVAEGFPDQREKSRELSWLLGGRIMARCDLKVSILQFVYTQADMICWNGNGAKAKGMCLIESFELQNAGCQLMITE